MAEVDLLKKYPKPKRKIALRASYKTPAIRRIARRFDQEYFDGERKFGYGGYNYDPRFWQPVVPDFKTYYHLTSKSCILDVGCAKGFMLFDFYNLIPGIRISGLDISNYAINHALSQVKPFLQIGNAVNLPYPDKAFDLVISINTIHNLRLPHLKKALREIERVGKNAFITVDAYRSNVEKKRLEDWNLTAQTYMHVDAWKKQFTQLGYTGDYYWFIP